MYNHCWYDSVMMRCPIKRSKKICLITHYMLNENVKVEGLYSYKWAVKEIVELKMGRC